MTHYVIAEGPTQAADGVTVISHMMIADAEHGWDLIRIYGLGPAYRVYEVRTSAVECPRPEVGIVR